MSKILITHGNVKIETTKEELMDVSETPDGVSINFKNGLQLLKADPYMPNAPKQLIVNTLNRFEGKKITVTLDNYTKPVMVDLN
jgi:phosphoribosylformylglycinamidine (FGAM) synthase-like amidotransferase family enzyme